MNRTNAVLAIVLAAAVAACQRSPEVAAAPPSTNAPQGAVEPASSELTSEPAATPRTAPRTSTRTARPSNHPSDRVVRVDRVPTPEPIDIPTDANHRADPARDENARRAESEPMAPEPVRPTLTLPAGTELQLVLEEGLSSATSHEGDHVTARVSRATAPDGSIVLPGGTVLKGSVYRAESAGRVSGKSHLAVDFDRIVVRGQEHRLDTTAIEVVGPDSHGRDAAIIGGSTVGGAIIGGILGGGSGAKKGAVVGVLGGTGAVLATKGKEVEIPAGSHWTVRVKAATRIE